MKPNNVVRLLLLALLGLVQLANAQNGPASRLRALTPDDLFQLEELGNYFGPVSLSPDGEYLAYVMQRPKANAKVFNQEYLWGNDRADIWLVSSRGGSPQNLTHGSDDGSGFWGPSWSPDGMHLAMLSTRGGNVLLYVWERASGQLRPLTKRGVNIWTFASVPYVWISNRELVCPVLAEGAKPRQMIVEMQAAQTAMEQWPKAWKGRESTASVLESGVPVAIERRAQGQLLLLDAITGKEQLITTGNCRNVLPSPKNTHVAFLRQVEVPLPNPERLFTTRAIHEDGYQLEITSSDRRLVYNGLPGIKNVVVMQWSNDGSNLAVVGHSTKDIEGGPQLFVFNIEDRTTEEVTRNDLQPIAIEWLNGRQLMMLAKQKGVGGRTDFESRSDWWLVEAKGRYRSLTSTMKVVPAQLIPEANSGAFVGLADGRLWRIRTDAVVPQNITPDSEPRITSIVWPSRPRTNRLGLTHIVVAAKGRESTDIYRIELSTGQSVSIVKPSHEASLIAFSPQSGVAVFTSNTRNGFSVWVSRAGSAKHQTVVQTNHFLGEVDQGELRKISYRSLDGQDLIAQLILPINYQSGRRYPLITWVYAGVAYGDEPPPSANLNNATSLNLQLLAAHGFAVLLPSMPLSREGEASDPYFELTKGVLPAIDKAIELGIADANRLGVMGASFGGYTVYGLISQTNRFKTAVALAGVSDLVSLYGQFDARYRYSEFPHEYLTQVELSESGQIRMGGPPWKDYARYLRNSPLFYVERIETPLMIIQGDMDYVPMQQGEQLFTCLYRRNKRAAFVRYWGEGHVLESPANINDMWKRIYGWFDQFLAAPK